MEINILGYTIIFFVLVITYRIYKESDYFHLKCIISDVDGNKYCVRERNKLKLAADKLANVNVKLKQLVKHVGKKYPDRANCKRLVSKFNPKKIYETLPTSEYTAYSQNKGEKLAFCLNTKKNGGKLIDLNTLTFVAIHELSHIASKSIGHNEEFWNNFKFLLEEAEIIGVYKPEDYKEDPKNYCGMKITDNPYYDL
jgi:hypothetical protein|tara:strand:- start:2069 stop:2659 length:591 start_codon:yes stop_codon:yes gene_type:complete